MQEVSNRMYMGSESRGASPAVGIILMVAIVVIIAAVISVSSFGFLGNLRDPAPNIAAASGDLTTQSGNGGGIVLLTHKGGDSVRVADLEIGVRAECKSGTKRGRIVNLPAGSENAIRASDGQIEGDNIFDESYLKTIDNGVDRVNDGGALLKNRYSASSTILFRIPKSKCELTPGSEVSVQVVHTPSQSVILRKQMTA